MSRSRASTWQPFSSAIAAITQPLGAYHLGQIVLTRKLLGAWKG